MTRSRTELPHIPALDGARGVGVLGVLLFHAGHLRGGWLGVDLFFVLSGFLITSLLLAEFEQTGRISIGRFWARRVRRLLPALLAVLVGVAGYAAVFAQPEALARIRGDGLATLFYVANWHALFAGHDYWELFRAPSPLDHTWSLAIEEQLYLVWPPLAYLLMRRLRGSLPALAAAAAGLALLSALWMALRFEPSEGTARVYFGTDTRAATTLIGAALAAALRGPLRRWPAASHRGADFVALVGVGVLAWAWQGLAGEDPRVYRGGLFVVALAAAALIAGTVLAPRGLVARGLGLAPLRLLGVISYGVYLWHWPIYLVLSPERVGLEGWSLTLLRLAVSLAVATLSYLGLERPIRRGLLPRGWPAPLAVAGSAVVAGLLVLGTAAPEGTTPEPPAPSEIQGPLDILLIGDSVAQTIGPFLKREAGRRGLHARSLGLFGCTLLQSQALRFTGPVVDLSPCQDLRERWRETVVREAPRVVLIIEGWPGAGEREVDGAWLHPCQPAFDEAYAADLRAALRDFAAAGAQGVLVVTPQPYVEDLQPNFLKLWSNPPLDELEQMFAERVACQNHVRRDVARESGAPLVDLESYLCPEAGCRRSIDGVRLRADGIHFRGAGAELAARWLLDQLQALRPALLSPALPSAAAEGR